MIALARPVIGGDELAAVERVLASGRLVLGPEAVRFEQQLAVRCEVPHAVAVSSGTAALHLALWALGVGPGDEVVVPALSFPAPAAAALAVGAGPVLADVDEASWNVTVETVGRAITPRTRAIIVVDQFGAPADLGAFEVLARDHGIALVEDAACSLGARLGGRACGSFGEVATTSFHPRKVVTTGEGGALLTRDPELAERARALRDHGRRDGRFVEAGLNLRLGEVQAALGSCQLDRLDDILARRRAIADRYAAALGAGGAGGQLGLAMQRLPPGAVSSWQTLAVLIPEGSPLGRDRVIADLAAHGIEAAVASFNLARLEAYAGLSRGGPELFPVAEAVHDRGLALPLHPGMGDPDCDRVVAALGLLGLLSGVEVP